MTAALALVPVGVVDTVAELLREAARPLRSWTWRQNGSPSGRVYFRRGNGDILCIDVRGKTGTVIVTRCDVTPDGVRFADMAVYRDEKYTAAWVDAQLLTRIGGGD